MRRYAFSVLLAIAVAFLPVSACGQTGDALDAVSSGQYDKALELLEDAIAPGSQPDERSLRLATRAMRLSGKTPDAEKLLRRSIERLPDLATLLGEVLLDRGQREEARELFSRAVDERHSDQLVARSMLGRLDSEAGRLQEAGQWFYSLIDAYNQRDRLSARELVAVGEACRWLGRDNPQLFKDALKAFDEAVAADPTDPLPKILLADLFLEKYDSPQAKQSLATVVSRNQNHPHAMLSSARILHFDGSPKALELAMQALGTKPDFTQAFIFVARLQLELEDFDAAEEQAKKALEIDSGSLEALTMVAAAHYLRDDLASFEATRDQILAANPRYAALYSTLAELASRTANYRAARAFAEQAIALDEKHQEGFHQLGMNQLRLGDIDRGQANLEKAFAGDPYNVWVKNTLDLLDTFPQYETIPAGRFELFIHESEAEVLAPYVGAIAEEAWQDLVKRYQFEPPTPIRIEVFPSHADFSVRTVGLAGLGALGVCFGPVLAIDSPSARTVGEANWGSTLWHELAHTFTLELTNARIPRWLTEGISVHEERRGRPGWGDDVRPEFLEALLSDELLGLSDLNNGIVRPKSPMQIGLSYYQASLVVEMIESRWGLEKVVEILHGYRDGGETDEIFAQVLDMEISDFDDQYFSYLRDKFAIALASLDTEDRDHDEGEGPAQGEGRDEGDEVEVQVKPPSSREEMLAELEEAAKEQPDNYRAQIRWGSFLYSNDRADEAIEYLERAKALFPEWASDSSAYRLLSKIYRDKGETGKAMENLKQLIDLDETHFEAHRELAELLLAENRVAEAAQILDRALYIYPLEVSVHEQLADLYQEIDEKSLVVRERKAILALDPPDRARAYYRLALAQVATGDRRDARRSILRALEIAPSYSEAQDLLLELVGESSS